MPIEFRILGPFELSADGRVLPLGSPKQRALLGLLLVRANETVSRDRLIEELWAEALPATGLIAHDTAHFALNANGQVTVSFDRFRLGAGNSASGAAVAAAPT
jgi:hypothetical protein